MLCVRLHNSELLFYENNNFESYVKKFRYSKVADFSLATNKRTGIHYFACYTLGTKGQPSFVKLYQYPSFDNVIANRSFYRTDNVTFKWRDRGKGYK